MKRGPNDGAADGVAEGSRSRSRLNDEAAGKRGAGDGGLEGE